MNFSAQTTSQLDCKLVKWTLTQVPIKKSMIRELNPTALELQTICNFGRSFAEESNAGEFEDKVFLESIHKLLSAKKAKVFILEIDNKIAGMLGVLCYKNYFNSKLRVQELFWWVDHEYRNTRDSIKLFNKVEEWAQTIGADEIMVSSTATMNVEKLEKFYTKKGFHKMDINYIRSLQSCQAL
jgi:N-acetylglutamate synthase-like GNAT family acetyltransferase